MSKIGKVKITQYPRYDKVITDMNSWADSCWSSNNPHPLAKAVFEDFFNGKQSVKQIADNYNESIGRIDFILITRLLLSAEVATDSEEIEAFRVWLEFNYRIESEYKKFKLYKEEGYYEQTR